MTIKILLLLRMRKQAAASTPNKAKKRYNKSTLSRENIACCSEKDTAIVLVVEKQVVQLRENEPFLMCGPQPIRVELPRWLSTHHLTFVDEVSVFFTFYRKYD